MKSTIGYQYLLPAAGSITVSLTNLSVVSGSSTDNLFSANLSESCRLKFTGAGTTTAAQITLTVGTALTNVGMIGLLGHTLRPTSTITPQFRGELINVSTTQWDNDTPGVTGAYDTYSDCGDYVSQQWLRTCFKSTWATTGTQRYTATAVRFYIKGLPTNTEFEIGRIWVSRALTFRAGVPYEADSMGYDDPSVLDVSNGRQVYAQERAMGRVQNITLAALLTDEVWPSGGRTDYLDRILAHSGRVRPIVFMPEANPTVVDSYQRAIYGHLQSLRYGPVNYTQQGAKPLHAADIPASGQKVFAFRSSVLEAR